MSASDYQGNALTAYLDGQRDGYQLGYERRRLNGSCPAHVDVDLIRDDVEGPIPHAFPCDLEAGHDGVHSATVTWLDGEE